MRRDTNYEGFYVKKEKFYQCSNCPQCYKELEEVERLDSTTALQVSHQAALLAQQLPQAVVERPGVLQETLQLREELPRHPVNLFSRAHQLLQTSHNRTEILTTLLP